MTALVPGVDTTGRTTTTACVAALHAMGEATLSELATASGLSRPTVKERLAGLPHLVEITTGAEHGQSPTPSGGRPAARFRFRSEHGFVIGAELGKRHERIVACDVGGRIRHVSEHREPAPSTGRERIAGLHRRVVQVAIRLQPAHGCWLGLGVSLTGGIGPDGRLCYSPHHPDLQGRSPADAGLVFGDVPVIVEHDLNAAAIAEHAYGAARHADSFALALAWHRLAAGIVLDGRVHRGSRNMAGELNLIDEGPAAPSHWDELETFLPVLDAAERGDPDATAELDGFAARAARHIAYLTLVLDPQLIVLGGPLARRRILADRIEAHVTSLLRNAYPIDLAVTQFPTLGPVLGVLQTALANAFGTLLGDPAFPARIDIGPLCPNEAPSRKPVLPPVR
ncbi:ROK family protein [Streptomyces sp. NPDC056061]|uniref:ROK family protein n=1 Tax=Streptomyces sp. NPDC056061 TaxID=3345700 RepID=UPI0035E1A49F